MSEDQNKKEVLFGAGCFWGIQQAFDALEGVLETEVGYSGGHVANPTYKEVCSGMTGHAEVVRVLYDPQQISFEGLLEVFWKNHDPTSKNKQGPDVGSQYRSAIYYSDDEQRQNAEKASRELEESGRVGRPVVTEIKEKGPFYRAEEYHQKYFEKKGIKGCAI